MTRRLEGVRVLDFSEHGFVPSAAAALGDFGADVVKIERLAGDAMRRIIASGMVATKDGYDFQFELFNRNKRGIALDVEQPAGREIFEKLVRWAEVYITNQLPRVRRKLRTEPSDVFALNPSIVYARGHGQGQRGPDAEAGGFDGVSYWARGGVAHVLTDANATRPTKQRPALGDGPSGMFLAGGICAGLVHVGRTGKGHRGRHFSAGFGGVDARARPGLHHPGRRADADGGRRADLAARAPVPDRRRPVGVPDDDR